MYEIAYQQKALDDLDEIHFHISMDSGQVADKMIGNILSSIERLSGFPFIGSSFKDKLETDNDYRMIVVKPYLVFYRVTGELVVINRILHSKRYYQALIE